MIEFQPWNALAIGEHGRFSQLTQLATIEEGLQDILLHVEVVVGDGGHFLAQSRQIFHRLFYTVIGDIIGGGFGAERQMIADILFGEAVAVVTADHRVGQIHVFDDGLQLSPIQFGDLAPEDRGDFVRLPNGAVGIQQPLTQCIQGRAAVENEIVAVFHLREE